MLRLSGSPGVFGLRLRRMACQPTLRPILRLHRPARRMAVAVLLASGFLVASLQIDGRAQSAPTAPITLPFSDSYLITGNYVTGAMDLPGGAGQNGFATGTIHMTGASEIPANDDGSPADILGAWLYWEVIVSDASQVAGAKFRGADITDVRASALPLTGPYASCWGPGGSTPSFIMYQMRADVRRLLPLQYDADGNSTGKRLVNDKDLPSGDPGHTVTLPEAGAGNNVPVSAGATLVVVYRDPRQPLRKIVIYDGLAVLPNTNGASLVQDLRGIYQSAQPDAGAQITQFGASGQPNGTDRWFLTSSTGTNLVMGNPFAGTSVASDRSWSSLTIPLSPLMPGLVGNGGYGETLRSTVDHASRTPYALRLVGRHRAEHGGEGCRSRRRAGRGRGRRRDARRGWISAA